MENPENQPELYRRCREKWGNEAQIDMAVEEAAEMIQARMKLKRNGQTPMEHFIDEIADVIITVNQVRHIVGINKVNERINFKLDRLAQKLEQPD